MAITVNTRQTGLTGNSAVAYAMKQINPGRMRSISDNPFNSDNGGFFKLCC